MIPNTSPNMSLSMWRNLGLAAHEYHSLGWQWMDTPWAVDQDVCAMTMPPWIKATELKFENYQPSYLVGSAEQGFISKVLNEGIPKGKYQSISPCFRSEENLSPMRRMVFMKLELFWWYADETMLDEIVKNACDVMNIIIGINSTKVKTKEGFDLEINAIEVGSYGLRYIGNIPYLYGTGIAEPRLTYAANLTS